MGVPPGDVWEEVGDVMNIGDHESEADSCDLEGDGTNPDQDMEADALDLIWKDATADVVRTFTEGPGLTRSV